MIQEDKEILLKDLCARLPYGVRVCYKIHLEDELIDVTLSGLLLDYFNNKTVVEVKPYLRSMSSMTEEEIKEAENISRLKYIDGTFAELRQFTLINDNFVDWLNAHHFDYRGLIEKELALEAPENMYLHFGDMNDIEIMNT